jgi:hypothetical protein
MRDLKASTVIAAIALFIVVGGTATAASGLINGKKIKPGTVTAKQIKNKTITAAKLNPATVKSLKGARGPVGATGPAGNDGQPGGNGATGATGATGSTGPAGIVDPYFDEDVDFDLPDGEQVIPLSLVVPSGTYLINAKLNAISHKASGLNTIDCAIWKDETEAVDESQVDGSFNVSFNMALMAVAQVQGKIELRCSGMDGPGQADDLKLIAVPVQS